MSARTVHTFRRLVTATAICVTGALLAVGATAVGASADTAFGGVVKANQGETYQQALARQENRYGGKLGVIRYFDSNAPDPWSSLTSKFGGHNVIISFRYSPSTINSGGADSYLRNWFATAPTNTTTYWTYMHEPEDDLPTSQQAAYRAAWTRIAGLADQANNPQLKATMILMCYTLNPKSGRNWRNYYAGPSVIDVLGWDCYNHGEKRGVYGNPTNLYSRTVNLSNSEGMPWGMAEFGSRLATGDSTGSGRAAWLTTVSRYFYNEGALFASYFDTNGAGSDYRLLDEPSRQAWFNVISDQIP